MQQILLFSRQKSRQLSSPKPQLRKKNRRRSRKPSQEQPLRPRLRPLPVTKVRRSIRIVHLRSKRSFSPPHLSLLSVAEKEKTLFCGVKMHRENAKIISMRVKTQNSSRTFRRRSRSWWIRSRRGHFYKVVRDETGVEIRVFVWWFYIYTRVCILKLRNKNGRKGVRKRERRRGGFLRKFFFGGGWQKFWLVKKSFLSFTHFEKKRATHQPRRTSPRHRTNFSSSVRVKKKKEGRKCTQKHRSLSFAVKNYCFE